MTLATHLTFGAAVAELITSQNPVPAFFVGFTSHFLLDALPHWDYSLKSRQEDPVDPLKVHFSTSETSFLIDLLKISADVIIGFLLTVLIFRVAGVVMGPAALSGAAGALLPDFLQFAYHRLRWRFLKKMQILHRLCHSPRKIPRQPIRGLISQVLVVGLALLFLIFN